MGYAFYTGRKFCCLREGVERRLFDYGSGYRVFIVCVWNFVFGSGLRYFCVCEQVGYLALSRFLKSFRGCLWCDLKSCADLNIYFSGPGKEAHSGKLLYVKESYSVQGINNN